MATIIVHPKKNQLKAVKAFLKAFDVLPDHVVKGVKCAIKQADNGQLKPYTGIQNMLKGQ